MIKKIIKIVAAIVSLGVLASLITVAAIFMPHQKARSGPNLGNGIEQIADSIATTYLFEVNHGKIVLIDAGVSPDAAPIIQALNQRGKTVEDVIAIFVTHSHLDHIGGIANFPKAQIYSMKEEVALLSGVEELVSPISNITGKHNKTPVHVTHPLRDGETVDVEGLKVTAFLVPGHTSGSALYLARGVLFFGDIIQIRTDLKMEGPVWLFSGNVEQSNRALASAVRKLESRLKEVKWIATSHNGTLEGDFGVQALREFVAR